MTGWLLSIPLSLRYALFAAIATLVNLASQDLWLALWMWPYGLMLAMGFGTGTGLVTKYLLDKTWIFLDTASSVADHSKKFSLYTATGIVTTAIFWGMEYSFDLMSQGDPWFRKIGAVVGLSIGYVTKYRLDRRFVFRKESL